MPQAHLQRHALELGEVAARGAALQRRQVAQAVGLVGREKADGRQYYGPRKEARGESGDDDLPSSQQPTVSAPCQHVHKRWDSPPCGGAPRFRGAASAKAADKRTK